ncbi:23S rRNA (pseudouridine(1915)-N(3))-methyltransferase RlmH [Chloracidobacterium thermophilum]|uniref:23S rRNA (pseudouridine(1915)-N(3))-methyltransferase RlmH n=1 Tax=Chloracidobacterium thermophilum TaxID=458033 RepID=UPI000738BB55|nr:23S rRNA (pseudouridine(1915)-N(3))-methyltransferase RlmH [Chloracidobacterium thermophilum]
MQVTFFVVGKTKSPHWEALAREYEQRIARFLPCGTKIVRAAEGSLAAQPDPSRAYEGKHLLAALPAEAQVVLLDVAGDMVTSEAFAEKLRRWRDGGARHLAFIIGGHWGVAEEVRQRADWCWSLSKLTFTHEMARVLAAEQVYRALARLGNVPYAK